MSSGLAERMLSDPAFIEALERVVLQAPELAAPFDSEGRGLSQDEVAFLAQAGVEPSRQAALQAVAQTVLAFSRLLATSLTTPEAAARLKVEGARVRQRLADRSLYGLKSEAGEWRLPAFQFDAAGQPIPHLGVVLQALPADLHPLEVESWLTSADPDLELEGVQLTPLQWLCAGGEVSQVVELAGQVGQAI